MPLAMPSYQVSLVLDGLRVLVVGSGTAAQNRVEALVATGAEVTVIANAGNETFDALPISFEHRSFEDGDTTRFQLVFAASGDALLDRRVATDARRHGVFVNANDDLENCSFVLPAVARRGPVAIAVTTDGSAPAIATFVRDEAAPLLSDDLVEVVGLVADVRTRLHATPMSTEGLDWRGLIERLMAKGAREDERSALIESFLADAVSTPRPVR